MLSDSTRMLRLIPEPTRIEYLGGVFRVSRNRSAWVQLSHVPNAAPESYSLTIRAESVELRGDEPGLFYGLQTLRQIRAQCPKEIPCLHIEDQPAFRYRGYLLDVSRGRVPRLDVLKRLVQKMAFLKLNQLQLYIEHTFEFSFDPSIARGCDPLTPSEIRELDAWCRAHHVELVPCLSCFGHMGRILSLSQYRALAEVPWPWPDWETAPWRLRLRGATLNPRHPEARDLIKHMLSDFLPCFSSPHFNMCGDETYDLGQGANAALARRRGIGWLYVQHVRFVRSVAREHGKRLMLWGDVLQRHPDAIALLPKDCIVLDWGYEPDTNFAKVEKFTRAGLDALVCPSTRGYKVVFNETEKARRCIVGYARAGLRAGAIGMLTTDWGDIGHFNLPAASLHGLALGAAMAWNPQGDAEREFDRAFAQHAFGEDAEAFARIFPEAGVTNLAQWPLLLEPLEAWPADRCLALKARDYQPKIGSWIRALRKCRRGLLMHNADLSEIRRALEALALNLRGFILAAAMRDHRSPRALRRRLVAEFLAERAKFWRRYAATWRYTSRTVGLMELSRAWRTATRAWRNLMNSL